MSFQEAKEFLISVGFNGIAKGIEGKEIPFEEWPEGVVIQTAEAVKKTKFTSAGVQ